MYKLNLYITLVNNKSNNSYSHQTRYDYNVANLSTCILDETEFALLFISIMYGDIPLLN